jgi:hypothetical protein
MSNDELMALKEKYSDSQSVLSPVDGILEARGKATREF